MIILRAPARVPVEPDRSAVGGGGTILHVEAGAGADEGDDVVSLTSRTSATGQPQLGGLAVAIGQRHELLATIARTLIITGGNRLCSAKQVLTQISYVTRALPEEGDVQRSPPAQTVVTDPGLATNTRTRTTLRRP